MPAKPSELPRFGDVSGDIAVVSEGKKDTGFSAGERPAAQILMWVLVTIYYWLLWLDESTDDDGWFIPRQERWPAIVGRVTTGTGTFTSDGDYSPAALTDVLTIPLMCRPGERIVSVSARVTDTDQFGGGSVTLTVNRTTDGTPTTIGTPDVSDESGDPQTLTVSLTEDVSASVGVVYTAVFTFADALPLFVHSIEVTTTTPP